MKFTLTDVAMTDIRYFAEHFGYLMFQELIRTRDLDPFYKTMLGKAKELVTLYGSYVLFCLMEASKPIDEDFVNKYIFVIYIHKRDKVAALWIEYAINPFWMFRQFLDVIQGILRTVY